MAKEYLSVLWGADLNYLHSAFTTEEAQPVTIIWTPDSSGENTAWNTGNQNPIRIPNSVIVDPLPENTRIDATVSPAAEAARKLGYDRRVSADKVPFNSHGQPAFFNGKDYITPDVDGHNVSYGWKKISKKGVRLGTYDKDLNRIKG